VRTPVKAGIFECPFHALVSLATGRSSATLPLAPRSRLFQLIDRLFSWRTIFQVIRLAVISSDGSNCLASTPYFGLRDGRRVTTGPPELVPATSLGPGAVPSASKSPGQARYSSSGNRCWGRRAQSPSCGRPQFSSSRPGAPLRRSSFFSRALASRRQGHHHFTAARVFLISSWRSSSPSWPCALTSTLQLRVWSFRHWRSDDEETETCGPKLKHVSTVRSCLLDRGACRRPPDRRRGCPIRSSSPCGGLLPPAAQRVATP
jgi:hypothetical protein